MEADGDREKIIFKATAYMHSPTSGVAVDCLASEDFLTIGSSAPFKIPLRMIEAVVTVNLPPPSAAETPGRTAPVKRFELTYLGEGGERWLTVLDFNPDDAEAFLKALQAANIQVNRLEERENPVSMPSFHGRLYLPAPGGHFEIAQGNISEGLFTTGSANPFTIALTKIETVNIVTTIIRTGKKPDNIPLLMKTVEVSFASDTGEKQVYSFGIDTAETEALATVLESEKIKVLREERVDIRLEYAGFWRRFLAAVIDGLILNTASSAIVVLLIIIAVAIGKMSQPEYGTLLFENTLFITNIGGLFYYLFFWLRGGRTPGKMALGVRVVTVDGNNISLGRAILRYFGYLVSWPLTLGIGYLWITWDRKKQGLHDKIAGTCVIKV
jgi:uncharacterized RDD family membrane protein YckC